MQQMSLFEELSLTNQQLRRNDLLDKLTKLRNLYESGKLGGTSHEVHPNLTRDSTQNYLYFTLAPAINFQRKSEALWHAALRTYNDSDTRFVFNPAMISLGKDEFRTALTKYGLALQTNKHTDIWFTLCRTLHNYYKGDPKNLLRSCGYDVIKIKELLKNKKKWFPYLSGPKLSNYWLYILMNFTDVELVNRHEISIIPDVHVIRATKHLGLLSPEEPATPTKVAEIWKTLLMETDMVPSDLHAPLWRWSRSGFKPDL